MHDLPHHYKVSATGGATGDVTVSADGLVDLTTQAPAEFGGPGDLWSPESLLSAAIADCFILSFRAIASASKFSFASLDVEVDALLDRVERKLIFTEIHITANLEVLSDADKAKAEKLLHMAEKSCLITNSLTATSHLQTQVQSTST